MYDQCLNLSLGGSWTVWNIRSIVGRVSALMVVGGGRVFGTSPVRSVLGGRRFLRIGRKWAGGNDRIVVILGGSRAGWGGYTVLRDIVVLGNVVGIGWVGGVIIAAAICGLRGLRGRNGPISAGRGWRGRRGGRVMVAVIKNRTTGIGPTGSLGRGRRIIGGSHFVTSVPLDVVIGDSWVRSFAGRDFTIIAFGGLRGRRDTIIRVDSMPRKERLLRVRIGARDRDVSWVVAIVGWN